MTRAQFRSVGLQALTVALLAVAVLAFVSGVISNPPPGAVQPGTPSASTGLETGPAPPIATPVERNQHPWSTPPEPVPGMAPFHGQRGDQRFDHLILRAARDTGIDPALIKAVIMAESGFNPQAVSDAGAQGLMQLMPPTAHALAVANALDPQANIQGGTCYLKQLLQRFDGNLELALAAYNAGSRNVRKHNGIPPFKTTRRYIAKVKIYHQYYRQQGFRLPSRLVAALPAEWHAFRPLAIPRGLICLSLMVRNAV
jgi:hypothetical protein